MKLGKRDAAVVMSEDGSIEVAIPKMGDDDPTPANVLIISAIACRLTDARWLEAQLDWFVAQKSKLAHKRRPMRETPR
jgi:hypothetical protein